MKLKQNLIRIPSARTQVEQRTKVDEMQVSPAFTNVSSRAFLVVPILS
jgi:hypothetical protein